MSKMHQQVLLLAIAQALSQSVSIVVVTVGALVGAVLAPVPEIATAPMTAMILGTAITTVPASLWMSRVGRRVGFVTGAGLGALGGAVAAAGVAISSFWLLCFGIVLVGASQAFAQFYRFAASEASDDAFRPRAVSLVLAGGVAAAILGPMLGRFGADLIPPMFTGSLIILAALALLCAVVLVFLDIPTPKLEANAGSGRPLSEIIRQPAFIAALVGAATGFSVMVLAMTATPLAMTHHDHGLDETTFVIQLHVLGMFVPSFFTGSLIARFGAIPVMFTGIALFVGHVLLSLSGTTFHAFAGALILLGVGWNFLFIGGTTLLTRTYTPAERGKTQAFNDMTIFVIGLIASFAAGWLHFTLGWQVLNLLLLPVLALCAALLFWQRRAGAAAVAAPAE